MVILGKSLRETGVDTAKFCFTTSLLRRHDVRWFGIAGWCVVFLCKLLSVFQGNLVLGDFSVSKAATTQKKNGVFFWGLKKI